MTTKTKKSTKPTIATAKDVTNTELALKRTELREKYISLGGQLFDSDYTTDNSVQSDIDKLETMILEMEKEDNELKELETCAKIPCPDDNSCEGISFGDIDSDYKQNPICLGCNCLNTCCAVTVAKRQLHELENPIDNVLLNGGKVKKAKKEKAEKTPKEERTGASQLIVYATVLNPNITIEQLVIDFPQFNLKAITRYNWITKKVLSIQDSINAKS